MSLLCWAFWSFRTLATISWIVPGTVWTDIDGVPIDAHGGMILKEGSTFYWIGSSYADSLSFIPFCVQQCTYIRTRTAFQPRIYTSTDLMNWVNEGVPFAITNMFRPKIF